MAKPKKIKKIPVRVPVAPPSKRHKTKKDYKRKKLPKNQVVKQPDLTFWDEYDDDSDEDDDD